MQVYYKVLRYWIIDKFFITISMACLKNSIRSYRYWVQIPRLYKFIIEVSWIKELAISLF